MTIDKAKEFLKDVVTSAFPTPVEIFVRHCNFSSASSHKKRPVGFSRENCHENFLSTLKGERRLNVTFLYDTCFPMKEKHFVLDQTRYPVIEIKEGNEGGSFCTMLDYVLNQSFSEDTIIYFLEDDYLHKQGWVSILREGIEVPGVDYVTLFDHQDKYFLDEYKGLKSELFLTSSTHWRVTPSTTNTYAMKFKTLKRDKELHYAFSRGKRISEDHAKFCALSEQGSKLISPIPGWSTHMEPDYLSPCVDWQAIMRESAKI